MLFVVLDTSVKCHDFSSSFPRYYVHNVPFDGQCAFSSICHQLLVKKYVLGEMSGDIVRREIVKFLATNEQLKLTISERLTEQSIDDYITDMALGSTWADENILYAASLLYDIEILVIGNDHSPPTCIGTSRNNRKIVLGYVRCTPEESATHYVSLVPATGLLLAVFVQLTVTVTEIGK